MIRYFVCILRQRDSDKVVVRRHVRHCAPEPAANARLPALHERRALAAQPQRGARNAPFRRSRAAAAAADARPRRLARPCRAAATAAAAAGGRLVARHAGAAYLTRARRTFWNRRWLPTGGCRRLAAQSSSFVPQSAVCRCATTTTTTAAAAA